MELKGSLTCSQEPATDPFPRQNKSSTRNTILFPSILITSSHLVLILMTVYFHIPAARKSAEKYENPCHTTT